MFQLVYITAGSMKEAEKISFMLVNEKLAACTNIFPVKSVYKWKNKIEKTDEFAIIAKTISNNVKEIIKKVKETHSYEVPCIITIPIKEGNKDFLNWVIKETS